MLVPRQQYSGELKIAAMRAIDSGKGIAEVIEKELAPFSARPHWGKLFTTSPAKLKSIYKKLPDFIQLSERYDPQGKFRNDFLNTNIF